jgi:hypothetical protein
MIVLHRLAHVHFFTGQFRVPSCPVIPHQPFRHTTGFVGALNLDRHRENSIHELCRFLHRKQNYAGADCRACPHRRWKTHAIQSIVHPYPDSLPDPNRLSGKMAQQRKREEAVSDRAAVWRLARRSLRVDVNPLPVFRRVRERLDAVLGQNQPIRRRYFAAFEFFQRI